MTADRRLAFRKVVLDGSYSLSNQRYRSIEKGIGSLIEGMPEGAELVLDAREVVKIDDSGKTPSILSSLAAKAAEKNGKLTVVVKSDTQVHMALASTALNIVTRMPSTPKNTPSWGKQGSGTTTSKAKPKKGSEVEIGLAPHGCGADQWLARW